MLNWFMRRCVRVGEDDSKFVSISISSGKQFSSCSRVLARLPATGVSGNDDVDLYSLARSGRCLVIICSAILPLPRHRGSSRTSSVGRLCCFVASFVRRCYCCHFSGHLGDFAMCLPPQFVHFAALCSHGVDFFPQLSV
jgi:hypothetical protein